MIQQLSTNIGSNLAKQLGYEKTQAEIFTYAMQIILETVIKVGLIITSAFILGVGKPTIIVLLTYGIIRTFGGGGAFKHFSAVLDHRLDAYYRFGRNQYA